MSITIGKINGLKERWLRACYDNHNGDYQQALVSKDVWDEASNDKGVAYSILGKIGISPNAKAMCKSMASAIAVLPDKDLWIAVGWGGVARLVPSTKRELAKKIKAIRAEAKGGKLPAVRARILTGGKPASKAAGRVTPSSSTKDPKVELNILVQEFRRLVSAGYIGAAALSPAALNVVGLVVAGNGQPKKRKRT